MQCACAAEYSPVELDIVLFQLSNTLPDSEMLSVICTALLDHVGSVHQAFATILLALRSMVTLTEHNYGVYHLKSTLEKNKEVFHRLLKRLSSSFETGIPGPDSLSTLSTTTELLQLLMPEEATNIAVAQESAPPIADVTETQEIKPVTPTETEDTEAESTEDLTNESIKPDPDKPVKQEIDPECVTQGFPSVTLKGELFGVFDVEELKPTSEISVSVAQMKTFLKADNEEEFTLKVLEKRLEESCKEDETLETLLEGITTLKQILEKGEDTNKEPEEDKEPDLPSSLPLQQLFNDRITFIAGDPEAGVSLTMWFSTPPPEDIEPETDMVSSDLDSLRTKYCPDFDLKAELEKGLVPSPPPSPIRKKSRVVKRKFDPLVSDVARDFKKFRGGYQGRGGRGGSRGMGRGRGRGGMGDIFRSRKQNTSRPPSMHVDDFMAMEQHNMQPGNKGQENMQNRRGGMKGPMTNRSPMDRGGAGFMGNQQRWANLPTPFRKGPGPQGVGGRGGAGGTPDWTGQRQFGGFPGQRGFQRGPNWSSPQASQQYRGGVMRENQYNRPQGRGYWDTPRTNKDSDARFIPSPNVGAYRPGTGRGYQGRHLRSFTR